MMQSAVFAIIDITERAHTCTHTHICMHACMSSKKVDNPEQHVNGRLIK